MTALRPTRGELRHRVKLQSRSETPVTSGDNDTLTPAYTTVDEAYARIEAMPVGRAVVDGEQVVEGVTHRITIDWRADAASWRYVWHDRARYRVHAHRDVDGGRRWLLLDCEETEVDVDA